MKNEKYGRKIMEETKEVYRVIPGLKLKRLVNQNFKYFQKPVPVLLKDVKQPIKSDLCKFIMETNYCNPNWIKNVYKKHRFIIWRKIGLRYRQGMPLLTEKFKKTLTTWNIYIEPYEDAWVGIKSSDCFNYFVIYSKDIMDKYFPEEVKLLKDAGLIEVVQVKSSEINEKCAMKAARDMFKDE